jgi:tetratricopeptide (TPR) repeat protein
MRRAVLCVKILVLCLVAASLAGVAAAAQDDAETLWEQGEKAYNDGRYREALSYYERSLSLCGEDLECAASDLNGIGAVYEALDDDRKALPYYERALAAARKSNNRDLIATNLFNVGAVSGRTFHQYEKALGLFEESLAIFRELDSRESVGIVLFNAGKTAQVLGSYEKALSYFEQSLKLSREMKNLAGVAGNLNLIGSVYQDRGQLDKPLSYYQEALRINRQLNDQSEIAITLRNIGNLYCDLIEYDKALLSYEEALALQKQRNLKPEMAATLNNIGTLYKGLNQHDKALSFYEAALKLNRELGRSPDVATNLNNMGDVYAVSGRSDDALSAYRESLGLERQVNRPAKMAIVLNNIGMEHFRLGRYDQALKHLNEALEIERKLNNPHAIAARLNNIGAVHLRQGKYREAEEIFLERRRLQARIAKTKLIHGGLIETYLALKRYDDALALLRETPPVWRDNRVRHMEYATQYGQALRGKGQLKESGHELLKAVLISEEMRRHAGHKEGFFAGGGYISRSAPHRLLVSVLAERAMAGEAIEQEFKPYGRDLASAAFHFAELTKARTLLEAMAGAARTYDEPEVSAGIKRKEEAILQQLAEIEAAWETAYKKGEAVLDGLAKRKEALERELSSLVAEIRTRYPKYAALKYPRPVPAGELSLRTDEVLIEYAVTGEEGYVFVIRKDGISTIHRMNVNQPALEEKVRAFMEPLTSNRPSAFSPKAAKELYEILLSAAIKDAGEGEKFVVVPDGMLGLLPFEALIIKEGRDHTDSTYVGDRRTITYSQSASALALTRLLRPSEAGKQLFALGNPVYAGSDPRYTAYRQGGHAPAASKDAARFAYRGVTVLPKGEGEWEEVTYPPLPETEDEVRAIATLLGVRPEMPDVLLNISASETNLRKASLKDYRYLHFATHADLPGKVQGMKEPFLILGQVENRGTDDGFFTLSEVLAVRLDADMVVLSACSTGRGKMMEGEGVANFSRAFQHAGTRSVVVSLWEVASGPAVEYMKTFYGHLKAGTGRAEALRLSRNAIKAKYPNPFYWAVFILHGEG